MKNFLEGEEGEKTTDEAIGEPGKCHWGGEICQ